MNDCKTVTLRTRPLKNRMLSFYLDYYPGYRDKETMKVIISSTSTNSRLISWSISVISSVNMTQSGNLSISISATSCMGNVLLRNSTLIFATSSVSTC